MGRPRKDAIKVPTKLRILTSARPTLASSVTTPHRSPTSPAAPGSGASLLYHYGSKEKLYLAVQEALFADLAQALAPSFVSQAPFAKRLMGMTSDYLTFLSDRPTFSAIVVRDLIDDRGAARKHPRTWTR